MSRSRRSHALSRSLVHRIRRGLLRFERFEERVAPSANTVPSLIVGPMPADRLPSDGWRTQAPPGLRVLFAGDDPMEQLRQLAIAHPGLANSIDLDGSRVLWSKEQRSEVYVDVGNFANARRTFELVGAISSVLAVSPEYVAEGAENPSRLADELGLTRANALANYPAGPSTGTIVFLGAGIPPSDLRIQDPTNINAADTTNANQLWKNGGLGLDLKGTGYTVGVWEAANGYPRTTHQEFGGRISIGDAGGAATQHATHVTGTISAAGVDANARGMANNINIRAFTSGNDVAEMTANAGSLVASNHSYGNRTGWTQVNTNTDPTLPDVGTVWVWYEDRSVFATEDSDFGRYSTNSRDVDAMLAANPLYLSVWSAGNDRNDVIPGGTMSYMTFLSADPGGVGWAGAGWYLVPNSGATAAPGGDGNGGTGYDSLNDDHVEKNALIVGAVQQITADPYRASDVVMSAFSNWGPTDDGRIKPDVVADGVDVYSTDSASDTAYTNLDGTSMAAPNVTGTAALLIEHYEDLYGFRPRSATMRGLISHTAFDAGTLGPDYQNGWGVMDASAAVVMMNSAKSGSKAWQMQELTYTGTEQTFTFIAQANTPLKATIAWTDPAGTAQTGLDNPTPVLVNDLDIWVTGPGGTFYQAWRLNPAMPAAAATRYSGASFSSGSANRVDNIEQVLIDVPSTGSYTIHVGHTVGAAFTQEFSLFVSELGDRFEANDALATATDLGVAPGVHINDLSIHNATDHDWFKVELLRPDSLRVRTTFLNAGGNLDLQVTDKMGTVIATGATMNNGEDLQVPGLAAGTYYVHVYGVGGAVNPVYALAIDPGTGSSTRILYVNDAITIDNVYTSAPGDDANDGLSPTTPKATIQDLLADVAIGANDLVLIDVGTYSGLVTISAVDEGAAWAGVPTKSMLSGNNARFDLVDADFNIIYGLTFIGTGTAGVTIRPDVVDPSTDNIIRNNRFLNGADPGVSLSGGDRNHVVDNSISGAGSYGITTNDESDALFRGNSIATRNSAISLYSGSVWVDNNVIVGASTAGIHLTNSGAHTISGNDISASVRGIYTYYYAATAILGNSIHDNTTGIEGLGIFGGTSWAAGQANDLFNNGTGILAYYNSTIQFNRIHHNTIGIRTDDNPTIHHNVIYRNANEGVLLDGASTANLFNNTIYAPTGDGIRVQANSTNVALRNNIIWAAAGFGLYVATDSQQGFSSDYNNLFTTGSGKVAFWQKDFIDLFDWQVEANLDNNSIGVTALAPALDNPQFVNLAGDDYHLGTGSTSIDAGDPASLFNLEPGQNGSRIDLGAYGNTSESATSPTRALRLAYPNFYTDWPADEGRAITWSSYDATTGNKLIAGSVDIDLYLVGVGKVADIAVVAASDGSYGWSPQASGIVGDLSKRYYIRLESVNHPGTLDDSREAFSVPTTGPELFVNDNSTVDDVYTTAIGNNRNTGRSTADPKAGLIAIMRSYNLEPSNTVKIDTGYYNQVRNVVISGDLILGDDEGATFRGPTDPSKPAILDRNNPYAGSTNIELNDGDSVTIENLTLTGARMGLWVRNNSIRFTGRYLTVSNNVQDGIRVESDAQESVLDQLTVFGNGQTGVYSGLPLGLLSKSEIHNNGTYGLYLAQAGDTRLESNHIYGNQYGVYIYNADAKTSVVGHADLAANKGNRIHDNSNTGVYADQNVQVVGNAVWNNANNGIVLYQSNSKATANIVYNNGIGIYTVYGGVVENNRIYHNTNDGIYNSSFSMNIVRGNVIYSNASGITISASYSTSDYSNNVIYDNSNQGVLINGYTTSTRLANNTIYQTIGDAIRLQGGAANVILRSNILWVETDYAISVAADSQTGFKSDYNDFHLTGTGKAAYWQGAARPTLVAWRNTAFQDQNSLAQDPLFVDPDGADGTVGYVSLAMDGRDDDFHVQSNAGLGSYHGGSLAPVRDAMNELPMTLTGTWTADSFFSPTINRGDPADSFANEPSPHGGYVDIGAYGNTAQTSSSPAAYMLVTSPDGGEVWPAKQPFPVRWRAENFGAVNALNFDGTDDFVSVAHHPSLTFGLGQSLTAEAWIKPDTLTGANTILAHGRTAGNDRLNFALRAGDGYANERRLVFYFRNSTDSSWHAYRSDSDVLNTGAWQHVAVSFTFGSAGSANLYVNGALVSGSWVSGTGADAPYATTDPMWIGAVDNSFGSPVDERFDGTMDEVRVWSAARTAMEIAGSMHVPLTGGEANLAGYWRMNEGSGGTTADAAPNGLTGILGGGIASNQPIWQVSRVALSRVNIDLMQDGNPTPVLMIATNTPNDGDLVWSIPDSLPPATNYRVRVTRTDGAMLSDSSNSPFEITPPITVYYVNDTLVNPGDWTTAPGNDANDGLTPATPKASVSSVLQAYDLELGDIIRVDDGTYTLAVNLTITANDSGVRIEGNTTGGRSAVLDRANKSSGTAVVELQSATNVTIADLVLTGGQYGLVAVANSGSHDFSLIGGRVIDNGSEGVNIQTGNLRATIAGTRVINNGSYGVDLRGIDAKAISVISSGHTVGIYLNHASGLVTGSEAFNNQYGVLLEYGATADATLAHDNQYGFAAYYGSNVRDSHAYRNTNYGVYLYSGSAALRVRANDNAIGVYSVYGGSISDSRSYHNSAEGIYVTSGYHQVTGNIVFNNNVGVFINSYGGGQVSNNLIYANNNQGVLYGGAYSNPQHLTNNTIYQPIGDAVRLQASSSVVSLRNNIFWVQTGYAVSVAPDSQVGFTSDYNDYRIEGTGKLGLWEGIDFTNRADWFYEVGLDEHGMTADPLFVDFNGPDNALGWRPDLIGGTAQVLDDGDAGFSTIGSWSAGPAAYDGDSLEAASLGYSSSAPNHFATWTFSGLDPDAYYELAITWPAMAGLSDGTRVQILEGESVVQTLIVNQQSAPTDFMDAGVSWERLNTVYVRGSAISVRIHNHNPNQFAPGPVSADAVRLQKVVGDAGLDDNFEIQIGSPTLDAGDPQSPFSLEPSPHGFRVNLGHTGNSPDAISSPPRIVQVLDPDGLEKFEAGQSVALTWRAAGDYPVAALDSAIIATSPMAYYRLNEMSGMAANDASGNGLHGTYVNGVTLAASGAPVAGGDFAAEFDGSNDRVSLPSGFSNFNAGFTAALWVYPTSTNYSEAFFDLGNGGYSDNLFMARYGSTDDLIFYVFKGGTQSYLLIPDVINNNTWQHFAVTVNATGTAVVYRNGLEVGRGTVHVPNNTARNTNWLGTSSFGGNFAGKLDEVAFYNRSLNAQELRQFVDPRNYGTVTLELMQDGNPVPIQTIAAGTENDGSFQWSVPNLPGSGYRIRATRDGEAMVTDSSNDAFVIAPATGHFYVDPAGDNTKSGRSPGDAVKSLGVILRSYDLDLGDVIEVAPGTYRPVRNIEFQAEDSGVLVQGPAVGHAILDRGNTSVGSYVIHINGATSVTLQNLDLTKGQYGLYAAQNAGSSDLMIVDGTISNNSSAGVWLEPGNDRPMMTGTRLANNGSYGAYVRSIDAKLVNIVSSGQTLGIYVTGKDGLVDNADAFNNSNYGIYVENGSDVESSRSHDNQYGIFAAYGSEIRDSETYRNSAAGIYIYSGGHALRVSSHDNNQGIYGAYGGSVRDSRAYHNSTDGISIAAGDFAISNNVAYGNSVGLAIGSYGAMIATNNLIYANSNQGVLLSGAYSAPKRLHNNTIYQPVGDAVRVQNSSSLVDLRNNIYRVDTGTAVVVTADSQIGFTSDYNDYHIVGSGKFGQWEGITFNDRATWFYEVGHDAHGLSEDPLWMDFDGSDNQLGWRPDLVAGTTQIIDDGSVQFSTVGSWSPGPVGHDGDSLQALGVGNATPPDRLATWTINGLDPDSSYEVAITWPAAGVYSSIARYRVLEGDATIQTTLINQQVAPNDFNDAGTNWERLGVFFVHGGQLQIQLDNQYISSTPGLPIVADAVRIQKVEGDRGIDDNFGIKAGSATLDAGDPVSPFQLEPVPNGWRVNLGHTGNTADALSSAPRIVQVLAPDALEKIEVGQNVRLSWHAAGDYPTATLSTAILDTAPLAYYRMNEASGMVAADVSGNSLDGTYFGGVTLGASGIPITAGDAAVQFDGNNGRVALPTGFANLSAGFTAGLWVYPTASNYFQTFFDLGNGGYNDDIFLSRSSTSADLSLQVFRGTTGSQLIAPSVIENNVWQHFAVTIDSTGTAIIYKNGVEVARGTVQIPNNIPRTNNWLGAHTYGYYHAGRLDEVVFYDRVLNSIEMRQLTDPRHYGAVSLELMQDGNPIPIQTISGSTPNDGAFDWTPPNLPGSNYRVRATLVGENTVTDQSNYPFLIAPASGHFYVSPTGDDSKSGRSPAEAVKTLNVILRSYDLDAGDVIEVAAGMYRPVRNIEFHDEDTGVLVEGPAIGTAFFDRGNKFSGSYVVELLGAQSVTLDKLTLNGGERGIRAAAQAGSHAFKFSNGVVSNNSAYGIEISSGNNAPQVLDSTLTSNGSYGADISAANAKVTNVTSSGHGYGISVRGTGSLVSGSESFANNYGIYVEGGAIVQFSKSHDNQTGFYTNGNSEVTDSQAYENSSAGIYIYAGGRAVRNRVYDNMRGIQSAYGGTITTNRVYHNSAEGITVSSGDYSIAGNNIYSNSVGVAVLSYGKMIVASNLIYANTNQGILVHGAHQDVRLTNNTVYQPVGDAIRLQSSASHVTVRNNIVWVEAGFGIFVTPDSRTNFDSNYNQFHQGTDPGAYVGNWNSTPRDTLADWRAALVADSLAIGPKELNSLEGDPQFVDIDGADNVLGYTIAGGGYNGGNDDNFYLHGLAPAIDRGQSWGAPATDLEGYGRQDDPGTVNAGGLAYVAVPSGTSVFSGTPGGVGQNWKSNNTYYSSMLPFNFPFYGTSYSQVYVSTEGFLQFGSATNAYDGNNSAAGLAAAIRIAPIWDNLYTYGVGDDIFIDATTANQVTYRWNASNEADNSDAQFAVTLYSDGRIRFDYGPGNTNLTPTVGISAGNNLDFELTSADGQSTLTMFGSTEFVIQNGIVDIGAYEFRGSSLDMTPPTVLAITPEQIVGNIAYQVRILFSEEPNPIDALAPANYELRDAGLNGMFGDSDDTVYSLTPQFTPGTHFVLLNVAGGYDLSLLYRVFVSGNTSIHDLAGNRLDGDFDGKPGGNYQNDGYIQNPGVTIDPTTGLQVTEGGSTAKFSVTLDSLPTGDVTVQLTPGAQIDLSQTVLTFTQLNWDTPQFVTITAIDDMISEPTIMDSIAFALTSTDNRYNGFSVPSLSVTVNDNDVAPPTVTTLKINDGAQQRSMVTSISVTFSEVVSFPFGINTAFQLERTGPGSPTGLVTLAFAPVGNTVTISFNDSTFATGVAKSLIDGRYKLTLVATKIEGAAGFLDGDGNGAGGDDRVQLFHRLFGDADGNASVTAVDFNAFRLAYGLPGMSIFDVNGDNQVTAFDFNDFRLRYGVTMAP